MGTAVGPPTGTVTASPTTPWEKIVRAPLGHPFCPDVNVDELGPRARIAFTVLQIVAEYAGTAGDLEATGLLLEPEETLVLAAERLIREHGDEAESRTVHGRVVSDALSASYLLDDYTRIRAVEQHDAFSDDLTDIEQVAAEQRRSDLLDQLVEQAERSARWAATSARICRCGANYGRHVRNSTREAWVTEDAGACGRFQDIEELRAATTAAGLLAAGWPVWLSANGHTLSVDDALTTEYALLQMRSNATRNDLTVRDLYEALAATL